MQKILLIISLVFMLTYTGFAQQVKVEFTINDGTGLQELNLGLDPSGTDGKDAIETELPPPPPTGIFYAGLEIVDPTEGILMLQDDYRTGDNTSASIGENIVHKIKWQLGTNGIGPTVCWDIYGVTINLKDEFGGIIVDFDVTTDGPGCYTIPNPALTSLLITIEYVTPPFSLSDKELFDLKVFLEGPFDNIEMSTALNDQLPLNQPFSGSPWNYDGNESVTEIPEDVVDWVLLELRTEASTPANNKRAAFLKKDGTIVDIDGFSSAKFYGITETSYYVLVTHRNHLSVMSTNPIPINSP